MMDHTLLFTRCISCGCPIERSPSSSKYGSYRALWIDGRARLTEPAINHDGKVYYGVTYVPTGYLRQREKKGFDYGAAYLQNVFVFHSICWDELVECFGARRIDLDILFDSCNKAPKTTVNYYRSKADNILARFVGATSPLTPPIPRIPWYKLHYQLARIPLWVIHRAWHPDGYCGPPQPLILPPDGDPPIRDPFVLLPMEICIEIACLLPTADFYNLRLASRTMYPVFHDQAFWKTRFFHTNDRQYIHAPAVGQDMTDSFHKMDWRGLYRCTVDKPLELERSSHIRMFSVQMNRWLFEATIHPKATPSDGPSQKLYRPDLLVKPRDKPETHLNPNGREFQPTSQATVNLPLRNATITVWIGRNVSSTYVSGLSIVVDDRPPVSFGYRTDEEPVTLKVYPLNYLWCAYSTDALLAIAVSSNHLGGLLWAGTPQGPPPSLQHYCYSTQGGNITVTCNRLQISHLSTPDPFRWC